MNKQIFCKLKSQKSILFLIFMDPCVVVELELLMMSGMPLETC